MIQVRDWVRLSLDPFLLLYLVCFWFCSSFNWNKANWRMQKKIPGLDSFERGEVGVERPINGGEAALRRGLQKTFRNEHLNDRVLAKQTISWARHGFPFSWFYRVTGLNCKRYQQNINLPLNLSTIKSKTAESTFLIYIWREEKGEW